MIASFEILNAAAGDDEQEKLTVAAWRDGGEEAAARRLVAQLTPLVRGVALRCLPRPWMVDDAVQNALTKVFHSLERFDHRVPLTAWAVIVAKNVCADLLRSWQRRAVISSSELGIERLEDYENGDLLPTLGEGIMAREELRNAFHHIATMEETDRKVAELVFMGSCSSGDAARQTGLSPGAIRLRIFRIRRALRDCTRASRGVEPSRPQVPASASTHPEPPLLSSPPTLS